MVLYTQFQNSSFVTCKTKNSSKTIGRSLARALPKNQKHKKTTPFIFQVAKTDTESLLLQLELPTTVERLEVRTPERTRGVPAMTCGGAHVIFLGRLSKSQLFDTNFGQILIGYTLYPQPCFPQLFYLKVSGPAHAFLSLRLGQLYGK